MRDNDFSDIERQIREAVESAFKCVNFTSIKENIDNSAKRTIDEVEYQIKDTSSYIRKKMKESARKRYENNLIRKNKPVSYISEKPAGKFSGIIYITIGTIGVVVFGVLLLVASTIISILNSFITISGVAIESIISIFLLLNVVLALNGLKLNNRLKRFKKYAYCIGEKNYATIEELAKSITKKDKFVVRDLEKMVALDMFKEAHFDDDKKYFMLSNEVYNEYLHTKKVFDEKKKKEENGENKEVDSIIEFVKLYIEQIRSENALISDSKMTSKLNDLEKILSEIFKYINKNPNKISEVRKLTNQYLPITLKLVTSYKELNNTLIQGENIRKAKAEIEKSIDLINLAFEKLLDNLFEDVALDISSDISVLETLFTQEGLTKNDFKK